MADNHIPRIFLDSNVIISGLYSSKNAPGKILEMFIQGKIDFVISQSVLEEVIRVINRKLPEVLPLFNELLINCPPEIVADPSTEEVKRWSGLIHREDAIIFAAAISAQPEYFVTGDDDFLRNIAIAKQTDLRIITPAQFLKKL
jgi:putative PIN family toxin of toxin-antitoxin system